MRRSIDAMTTSWAVQVPFARRRRGCGAVRMEVAPYGVASGGVGLRRLGLERSGAGSNRAESPASDVGFTVWPPLGSPSGTDRLARHDGRLAARVGGGAARPAARARCSVHAEPSQYRWPPEPSGSGYQPAGVGGVVIGWVLPVTRPRGAEQPENNAGPRNDALFRFTQNIDVALGQPPITMRHWSRLLAR